MATFVVSHREEAAVVVIARVCKIVNLFVI